VTEIERYGAAGGGFDLDVIREQFAPAASRLELEYFALVCRHLDLDPWAGHIYLIGRRQKVRDEHGRDVWRLVHKPQIAVAGRRAIASRTRRLVGIDGPYWCGPRRLDPAGNKLPLEWTDVWDDDDSFPYAARVFVWPAGWRTPANGTVKWSEFAVYDDAERTRLGRFWKHSPSHMLGKVAESLALRRGFPEVEAAVSYTERPGELDSDDQAVIAEAEAEAAAGQSEAARLAGLANQAWQSTFARPPARADDERPPQSYYDQLPEAVAHQPADAYRYDPGDTDPGARFTE
jgi:RecT family